MSDSFYRSSNRRIFSSHPVEGDGATIDLDEDAVHHLTRVLRLREGTRVDLADGTGRLFEGVLTNVGGDWRIEEARLVFVAPKRPARVLVMSLIKPDRFEWVIEKAGELGFDVLLPVHAARGVITIEPKKVQDRVLRWQKIADGAARQSERLTGLKIDEPASLERALAATASSTRLMLDEASPLVPWPRLSGSEEIALFIGPEGGWDAKERALLMEQGALGCGLGPSVLRAETAAVSAMSIVHALSARLIG